MIAENNSRYEPIPTEHSGVTFRSKSEAIFAKNLDLKGIQWEYEPLRYSAGNWCPDFLICICKNHGGKPHITLALLEYKPSLVTDAYLASLAKKITESGLSKFFPVFVVCGNSFSEDRSTFLFEDVAWNEVEKQVKLLSRIDEASRHRFDLVH